MKDTYLLKDVPSLISREASTAIKGLLMLLVVFGHTSLLTTDYSTGDKTFLWKWLYTFHVYIFFILPFIYGYKRKPVVVNGGGYLVDYQQVIRETKRNIIKIGVPYTWFFILSAIIYIVVGGGQFDIKGLLYTYFWGNEPLIDQYIGFNFMWFLPAMLALLTLKSIWYNSNKTIKTIIMVLSVTLWFLFVFRFLYRFDLGMYVPFAISQAFYFILYGIVSRWIIERNFRVTKILPLAVILLIGLTMIYYLYRKQLAGSFIYLYAIVNLFMPLLVFIVIYSLRDFLAKSRILKIIGKYSLQIYLFHVFVLNAVTMVVSQFTQQGIFMGFVIYVISILASLAMAVLIEKISWLNRMMFPQYQSARL